MGKSGVTPSFLGEKCVREIERAYQLLLGTGEGGVCSVLGSSLIIVYVLWITMRYRDSL